MTEAVVDRKSHNVCSNRTRIVTNMMSKQGYWSHGFWSLGNARHSVAANENVAAIKVSLKLRALNSRARVSARLLWLCWCVCACKHESLALLLWG